MTDNDNYQSDCVVWYVYMCVCVHVLILVCVHMEEEDSLECLSLITLFFFSVEM